MTKRMSRTFDEYVNSGGWSSHYFLSHAKELIPTLNQLDEIEIKIGRHVIHIHVRGKLLLKAYVHYKGRSREYLTFTDKRGVELETFHHTDSYQKIGSWLGLEIAREIVRIKEDVSHSQSADES